MVQLVVITADSVVVHVDLGDKLLTLARGYRYPVPQTHGSILRPAILRPPSITIRGFVEFCEASFIGG